MKTVILVFYGSRGDVEPFIALTCALLAETDRNIRLFSDAGGATIARDLLGPRATSPRVAIERLSPISPAAIWAAVLSGDPGKLWAALGVFMATAAREHGPIVAAAAKGAHLVFASYLARPYVYAISQAHGIPAAVVQLQPQVPTAAFPHHAEAGWIGLEYGDSQKALGEETSMRSYERIEKIAWAEFESAVAEFREQIGAGPAPEFEGWMRISRGHGPLYVFNGFPSSLVAKPEDAGGYLRSVGSINLPLEEGYEPPAELVSFLDGCGGGSSAPLYIGWGSMLNLSGDVAAWSKLAFHTAHALRKKAVIHRGAAQLSVEHVKDEEVVAWAKENTLTVDSVPHAWLLPRCSIAVHHGGAGTTSAALRAAIPAVITPLFADQYAWGIWVKRNNCGERTGPSLLKLSQDELICAIQGVQKDWARVKENVTQVSTHMGNESGALGLVSFAEVVGDGKTFFQESSYEFQGVESK